jgi:hypothetical protein
MTMTPSTDTLDTIQATYLRRDMEGVSDHTAPPQHLLPTRLEDTFERAGTVGEDTRMSDQTIAALEYGEVIMGIPCGSEHYVQAIVAGNPLLRGDTGLLGEVRAAFEVLHTMSDDPQSQAHYLRMVLPAKIMHLLRGLAPIHSRPLVEEFNRLQREAIASMCGVPEISDLSYALALQWKGGAGFGNLSLVPEPAFVASILSALPDLEHAIPGITDDIRAAYTGEGPGRPCNSHTLGAFVDAVKVLNAERGTIYRSRLPPGTRRRAVAENTEEPQPPNIASESQSHSLNANCRLALSYTLSIKQAVRIMQGTG